MILYNFVVGYTIGSWIGLTFTKIHFNIGPLLINQHNFVGLFLIIIQLLNTIVIHFFAYNCSKEYDLKSILYKGKDEDIKQGSASTGYDNEVEDVVNSDNPKYPDMEYSGFDSSVDQKKNFDESSVSNPIKSQANDSLIRGSADRIIKVLKGYIHQPYIILIMTSSFWFAGIGYTMDLLYPIIVLNIYKWREKYLDIAMTWTNIVYFVVLLSLSKYCVSRLRVYGVVIFSIISSIICLIITTIMVSMHLTMENQIILLVICIVTYQPVWLLDSVTLPIMLGNMVPAEIQSFSESVRTSMSLMSNIISGLVIAAGIPLQYLLIVLISCSSFSFLFFAIKGRQLREITPIVIH